MIYDEAMEVNVNGYSFLAFHKFELLGRFGVQIWLRTSIMFRVSSSLPVESD